jgi:hypothetical protein
MRQRSELATKAIAEIEQKFPRISFSGSMDRSSNSSARMIAQYENDNIVTKSGKIFKRESLSTGH